MTLEEMDGTSSKGPMIDDAVSSNVSTMEGTSSKRSMIKGALSSVPKMEDVSSEVSAM